MNDQFITIRVMSTPFVRQVLADRPRYEVPVLSWPYEADTILHLMKGVVDRGSVGKEHLDCSTLSSL